MCAGDAGKAAAVDGDLPLDLNEKGLYSSYTQSTITRLLFLQSDPMDGWELIFEHNTCIAKLVIGDDGRIVMAMVD